MVAAALFRGNQLAAQGGGPPPNGSGDALRDAVKVARGGRESKIAVLVTRLTERHTIRIRVLERLVIFYRIDRGREGRMVSSLI